MGKIRVLSDAVANKIAAGEVVERPASVVKELLENSLDAGATEIRIEIESGGRRLIRVADNGCGMGRDDALLAFERHATSKLRDVKDLLSIATLGFRGEALPSIGSVSRLLLETRTAEERTGTRVEIAGGTILRCDEHATTPGTAITIRDLFFNVPARKKFLRSDSTELAHVAALATHYSLAHSDKAIRLASEGRPLLDVTPVASIRERVYQVFGSRAVEDLVEVPYTEKELQLGGEDDTETRVFGLRGFVSGPQVQKLNRKSIYLFVNGRLIRDKVLLHALSSAYHNLIPPACYPFALLFLDCDCEEVDVNVHPSKTEVRFRHGSLVHDFVRDTLRGVLMESRPVSSLPLHSPPQAGAALPYSEFTERIENQNSASLPDLEAANASATAEEELPQFILRTPPGPSPRFDFSAPENAAAAAYQPAAPADSILSAGAGAPPDTHRALPDGFDAAWPGNTMEALTELRSLGQIHDSFIIAAGRDGLWIIDQHVAHERILFEKVLRQQEAGHVERQQLLLPIMLELTPSQQVEYARMAAELDRAGFETEPFGNRTIAVKGAPADVGAADLENVIYEILEIAERELRKSSVEDLRRSMAASIACRAAIKINTRLDAAKIDWLLRQLAACAMPMSCPHGRPIALRYTTREILKSFHRI